MKIVSWPEYTDLLKKLHEDLGLREFDALAGIGRGGSLIAAYLASKLGIPTFSPIFVRHVGRGTEMKIVAEDLGQVRSLKGRLLLVDDWLCEGRAMRYVLDRIPKDAAVTTMVMFCRTRSEFKPDSVGKYIEEKEREILFPYDPIG
jgi:hypoxanthine phosphoribosyltransferase